MICSILHFLQHSDRDQRGQVLVVATLFITVLAAGAAMSLDVGNYLSHRRNLQNSADAIALAASQELPTSSGTLATANQWAVKNGVDLNSMTVTIIPQHLPSEPNPKVKVEIAVDHGFTFARLMGVDSVNLTVSATAIITSAAGGDGVAPLSVTEEALEDATFGQEVVLKYDANDIKQGNTAPLQIDGPGSGNCGGQTEKYCSALQYGSESVVCADGVDPTYCNGPSVANTEPGNKVGPTRTAINERLDSTDAACSDFEGAYGVFEDDPTTSEIGVYRIRQDCNPFLDSSNESHRVLIIPVIDELCNGSCEVTVVAFALFFLERIGDGGCTGNDCEIVGRFVTVNQNIGLLAGTFDSQSSNTFVRLVD